MSWGFIGSGLLRTTPTSADWYWTVVHYGTLVNLIISVSID